MWLRIKSFLCSKGVKEILWLSIFICDDYVEFASGSCAYAGCA